MTPSDVALFNLDWAQILDMLGLPSASVNLGDSLSGTSLTVLTGTLAWNPPPLAVGEFVNSGDITITGAALGDTVLVSAPYSLAGVVVQGYVTATNTVQFDVYNMSIAQVDLANGTWKIKILQ